MEKVILPQLIDNFNLKEKDAKTYLACLELGLSRASQIAKVSGLNRVTTYDILKRLIRQGIASTITYENITRYKVIAPDLLLKKQQRKFEIAKDLIPNLMLLKGVKTSKPQVDYYDGKEGIRSIYEQTLNNKNKEITNIAFPDKLIKTIGDKFFQNYVKKRIRRKIKVKVLLPNLKEYKKYKTKEELRQVRFFDAQKYQIPNEILIWDNKVALLSFENKIGVIVEDYDISSSLKTMWSMVWDNL